MDGVGDVLLIFDAGVLEMVKGQGKYGKREAGGDEDIMDYRVMARMKVKMRIS